MIERIEGSFILRTATGAIVDVGGIGYGIELPLPLLCRLPKPGQLVQYWIYTHVREDQLRLYGFSTYLERCFFELLLSLSGVGPKVALGVLSTLQLETIKAAVSQQRADVFELVPGIGKRLAEKILVDLKPKLEKMLKTHGDSLKASSITGAVSHLDNQHPKQPAEGSLTILEDVKSALENFGFKEREIAPILKKIFSVKPDLDFQDLMREALKEIGDRHGTGEKAHVVDSNLF